MPVLVQRAGAVLGLIALAPLLGVLASAVWLTSPGPVLHRATRIGRGRPFVLFKFRTMARDAADAGPAITAAGDPRVTRLGRALRRTKLDELPQLWNVARGDMLLVGPRPEDPRFVDWEDPIHRLVFGTRPGITGPTAIAFREEETLLAAEASELARSAGRSRVELGDVERAYRERVLPRKLAMDMEYLRRRSTRVDIEIIAATIAALVRPGGM